MIEPIPTENQSMRILSTAMKSDDKGAEGIGPSQFRMDPANGESAHLLAPVHRPPTTQSSKASAQPSPTIDTRINILIFHKTAS
jgi:hypothetical protein